MRMLAHYLFSGSSPQAIHRQNSLQNFFVYHESRIQSQITIKYKSDMSYPQKYYPP